MTAPIVYRSSDASAPVLTGAAGSLITVLDGCLVNGYGTQAAAGWTKAFTGTNKADYRMAGGNQFYMDIDDSAAQTAAGKEANVRGYESMTALQTGTNPFPTTAQFASPGPTIRKSATADSTPRAWILIADDRTFYMFVLAGDFSGFYYTWCFGDIYSYISADPGRTMCGGRTSANTTNDSFMSAGGNTFSNNWGYLARAASGTAGAIPFGTNNDYIPGDTLHARLASPDAIGGQIWMERVSVGSASESSHGIRGFLRGIWVLPQNITPELNDGDTFSGTGALAGRSFLVVTLVHQNTASDHNGGWVAVETSNTWDTSS